MQKADLTSRAVAGFIDLLLIIGLTRLPDVIGFLAATGYILARDGLFANQSIGKKAIGLSVAAAGGHGRQPAFRESIIRNVPLALAYMLFWVPYAGWVLGPLALAVECLTAIGDERGMRIGDLLAGTWTVQPAAPSSAREPGATMEQQPDFDAPAGNNNPQND